MWYNNKNTIEIDHFGWKKNRKIMTNIECKAFEITTHCVYKIVEIKMLSKSRNAMEQNGTIHCCFICSFFSARKSRAKMYIFFLQWKCYNNGKENAALDKRGENVINTWSIVSTLQYSEDTLRYLLWAKLSILMITKN